MLEQVWVAVTAACGENLKPSTVIVLSNHRQPARAQGRVWYRKQSPSLASVESLETGAGDP